MGLELSTAQRHKKIVRLFPWAWQVLSEPVLMADGSVTEMLKEIVS